MASSGCTLLARRETSTVSGSIKRVFDWFLRANKKFGSFKWPNLHNENKPNNGLRFISF